ncbi:hypothetical protein [Chryseobacterium sp. Leaf394]|uniref:hypothetical protein n=1 Tax=Chryseobacterium sp. Leaf394 TaxID=1736361 RepID=UPI000B00B675|nr:hypothetical protein [Chryseobacterium sp. Leaf394]
MKYTLLLISFIVCFNYSCKESGIKEKQNKTVLKNINNTETLKSNYQNLCNVIVKEKDIIIDCGRIKVYSNLIIDEMSISTEFIQGEQNTFSLLYEFNASVTKVKEKYDFVYSAKGLRLIKKETLKYGREGISFTKVYFKKYMMEDKSFDDIQSLASNVNDVFNKYPLAFLYDNQQKLFGKEIYDLSREDFYINYPDVKQPNLDIVNVELANNLAFDLQNENINISSKLILESIVEKYPDRVVAWLNLGDVYWSLKDSIKAKDAYQKYISLMKSQKKDLSKIPQRVYYRTK